jgi:hypothetical protein
VTAPQLDVFGPYPAAPEVRQACILAAFGSDVSAHARAASMQAKRGRCLRCQRGIGEECEGPHGRLRWPHPSRVALSMPCHQHDVGAWEPCPGLREAGGVCSAREELVQEVVALFIANVPRRTRFSATMKEPEEVHQRFLRDQGLLP